MCTQLLPFLYQLSTIAVQPAVFPLNNSCFLSYNSCQQVLCSQLFFLLTTASFPLTAASNCCAASHFPLGNSCFLSTSCQQLLYSQLFFLSITAASFPIPGASKCCAASKFPLGNSCHTVTLVQPAASFPTRCQQLIFRQLLPFLPAVNNCCAASCALSYSSCQQLLCSPAVFPLCLSRVQYHNPDSGKVGQRLCPQQNKNFHHQVFTGGQPPSPHTIPYLVNYMYVQ